MSFWPGARAAIGRGEAWGDGCPARLARSMRYEAVIPALPPVSRAFVRPQEPIQAADIGAKPSEAAAGIVVRTA
jgi:hypothetical protein